MLKICTKCNLPKDEETEFAWKQRDKGKRHRHCRACQSGVSKAHYLDNRGDYISRVAVRNKEVRDTNLARVKQFIEGKTCHFCQSDVGLALVRTSGKSKVTCSLLRPWDYLQAEIDQCVAACSSCRRRRKLR